MGSSFFGDPVSFALFCGLLIGMALLIMKFSNFIGSFTAIGATLLCPVISPFWDLINRISNALPTIYSVGSPIAVVFALCAACFFWWRIGSLAELLGWEGAMEMLMEGSALGFLITVFSGEAFDGFTDIPYILTSGLNALLMATLAHAFLAALVEPGDWVLLPLQLLYGVIFVVFCICLGYISARRSGILRSGAMVDHGADPVA